MTQEQIRASAVFLLTWVAFLSAGLVAILAAGHAHVSPPSLFPALVELELFFVVLVWPFFLPGIAFRAAHVAAMLLLAVPPVLLCAGVSETGMLPQQLLVAAVALFAAALQRAAPSSGPWYFLAAFALGAGVPLLHFLLEEHGGAGLDAARWFSPFWAALEPGTAAGGAALFAAAALAVGAPLFFRKNPETTVVG